MMRFKINCSRSRWPLFYCVLSRVIEIFHRVRYTGTRDSFETPFSVDIYVHRWIAVGVDNETGLTGRGMLVRINTRYRGRVAI